MTIRLETKNDYRNVEKLIRKSFWNVYRPGCCEHYLMNVLRRHKDFIPQLTFVMESKNEKDGVNGIIGQNTFFPAKLVLEDGTEIAIATMGPICIHPDFKRMGYGKKLLDYGLEKAREYGFGAVCFEGNIDFYGKSGFVPGCEKNISYWGEPENDCVPYFLCKNLVENYIEDNLRGRRAMYHTPGVYLVNDSDVEEFDRKFAAE